MSNRRKSPGCPKPNKDDRRRAILSFLDSHGTVDKDSGAGAEKSKPPTAPQKKRRHCERMTLDLHGMTADQADEVLHQTLRHCRTRGVKRLLIIHGWGRHGQPGEQPVLKNLVTRVCERLVGRDIVTYRRASPRDGGEGATLVTIL